MDHLKKIGQMIFACIFKKKTMLTLITQNIIKKKKIRKKLGQKLSVERIITLITEEKTKWDHINQYVIDIINKKIGDKFKKE